MSDAAVDAAIQVFSLGILPYREGLALQERLHAECIQELHEGVCLTCQHTPVLTLGKNAENQNITASEVFLQQAGIDVVATERGGQVTAHEPGQLVVYPILPLSRYRLSPRRYVWLLEEAVIRLLAEYGVQAHRDAEYPGVWAGAEKVCALGIRIKERVSMHGLALNVQNDLTTFRTIVPCGIQGRGVTTMERLLDKRLDLTKVEADLVRHLMETLGFPWKSMSPNGLLAN